MARVEEARRGALGRLLALQPRAGGGHRVAALLDRRADRLEVLRRARAVDRGRRPLVGAERGLVVGLRLLAARPASGRRGRARGSRRRARPRRRGRCRGPPRSCCACSRRSLRARVVISSPIAADDQRQERERDEAGHAAAVASPAGSRPARRSPMRSVKSSRIASMSPRLRLERVVGRLRRGALAQIGAAGAERPPRHQHVGPAAARRFCWSASSAPATEPPPSRTTLARQERDVHRPGVLVGDPLPQLLGLRVGQLRRRVRVDVDRVARERLRRGVERAGPGRARRAPEQGEDGGEEQQPAHRAGATHRRGSGRARAAAAARRRAAPTARRAPRRARCSSSAIRSRERLQRVRDRVGQVDPVGVRPLGLAPLDPHGVAGVADHRRVRRHVVDDDRVGADLRPVPDPDRPEQLGAGADRHVVLDRRVALAGREAGAAQRHALVERHVLADLGRLADHDAHPVVDEQPVADVGARVDLDPGHRARGGGDRARRDRHARLAQRVRHAVGEQRVHARPGGEDLEPRHAAGGGVALVGGGDVAP